MPDYDELRRTSESKIQWRNQRVTLVRVHAGGQSSANTLDGKRRLLNESAPDDLLLAAWMGEWRADVLLVDDRDAAADAIAESG
jgi:hypothetical protein